MFLARPPKTDGSRSEVLMARADGSFKILSVEGFRARLGHHDSGLALTHIGQPVATSRLIKFPWMQRSADANDEVISVCDSDEAFEGHPTTSSINDFVSIYNNTLRVAQVQSPSADSRVTVPIWVRDGPDKWTMWRPGFWEPDEALANDSPGTLDAVTATDTGRPAITVLQLTKIYKVVEMSRGVLRDYNGTQAI